MRNYNRITPEGTKDLLLEECLVRRETEEKIRSFFPTKLVLVTCICVTLEQTIHFRNFH